MNHPPERPLRRLPWGYPRSPSLPQPALARRDPSDAQADQPQPARDQPSIFRAARNASCGISILPIARIRFGLWQLEELDICGNPQPAIIGKQRGAPRRDRRRNMNGVR